MDSVARTPTEPVDYAAISAGYAAAAAAVLLATRDRSEETLHPAEIVPLGVAAFALAKLISKEKVESWMREPFVEELPSGERRPKGRRLRYAVGELLTCTRCVGAWSSLALVGLRLHAPRAGRTVTTVLAASAGNDALQAGFSWLTARANEQAAAAEERERAASRPEPA